MISRFDLQGIISFFNSMDGEKMREIFKGSGIEDHMVGKYFSVHKRDAIAFLSNCDYDSLDRVTDAINDYLIRRY